MAAQGLGFRDRMLRPDEVEGVIASALAGPDWDGQRVLAVIPDLTRSCPMDVLFEALHRHLRDRVRAFDVMVALGTHPPLTPEQICRRVGITAEEMATTYGDVRFLNHAWDDPAQLLHIGDLPESRIAELTEGRFAQAVPVTINRAIQDYDRLLICGPVFPHEVVGVSGGNKYFFPGISGPDLLNFFHWLGAVITNPVIIGNKWTPVRKVVDEAAALIPCDRRAFCMVVQGGGLAGLHYGTPEEAWSEAADLSRDLHIEWHDRPYHTVLSCAPPMYDEMWVGGKCMYKLEPVVADGGTLIIYAPHIREVSVVHGRLIREIGYHVRDYFLAQWDRFKDHPWGILAHSTHVKGIGRFEDGVETPRVEVVLATGIPEAECRAINLGYRDPASIRVEDFQGREAEGILHVPKAGEQLYRCKDAPPELGGG